MTAAKILSIIVKIIKKLCFCNYKMFIKRYFDAKKQNKSSSWQPPLFVVVSFLLYILFFLNVNHICCATICFLNSLFNIRNLEQYIWLLLSLALFSIEQEKAYWIYVGYISLDAKRRKKHSFALTQLWTWKTRTWRKK